MDIDDLDNSSTSSDSDFFNELDELEEESINRRHQAVGIFIPFISAILSYTSQLSLVDDTKADEMNPTSLSKPSTPSELLSHETSLSSRASSSSTPKRDQMTEAIALTNIGRSLSYFVASYQQGLEMEAARHKDRLKMEAAQRKNRLEIKAVRGQNRLAEQEDLDVIRQAFVQAQDLETNLPPLHLAVLFGVLENPVKAKTYLLIKGDDAREAWVSQRLMEKGVILPANTSDSTDIPTGSLTNAPIDD
jgi:hypothetical protein